MPKWLKRQMSLGMAPVIPAGIGLRSDDGHPSGGGTAPAGGNNDGGGGDAGADNNSGQDSGDKGKGPKFTGDFDRERAERALEAAREAERKAKADKKAAEDRTAAILKAAGLTPDGKEDPEQLAAARAAELDAAKAKARSASVELAVYRTAADNGGDAARLLDSRAFTDAIAGFDPDAKNFADKVGAAIKSTVEKHPHLAADTGDANGGQGPARQGVDHSGGGSGKERPKGLFDALNRRHQ